MLVNSKLKHRYLNIVVKVPDHYNQYVSQIMLSYYLQMMRCICVPDLYDLDFFMLIKVEVGILKNNFLAIINFGIYDAEFNISAATYDQEIIIKNLGTINVFFSALYIIYFLFNGQQFSWILMIFR